MGNAQVHGRKRWMLISENELQDMSEAIASKSDKVRKQVAKLANGAKPAQGSASQARSLLQKMTAKPWFEKLLPLLSRAGVDVSSEQVVVEAGEVLYGPGSLN